MKYVTFLCSKIKEGQKVLQAILKCFPLYIPYVEKTFIPASFRQEVSFGKINNHYPPLCQKLISLWKIINKVINDIFSKYIVRSMNHFWWIVAFLKDDQQITSSIKFGILVLWVKIWKWCWSIESQYAFKV